VNGHHDQEQAVTEISLNWTHRRRKRTIDRRAQVTHAVLCNDDSLDPIGPATEQGKRLTIKGRTTTPSRVPVGLSICPMR
jgi:hypothetical protein